MENNGYLVISLDFELLWGVFDKVDRRAKEEYFKNTRRVIPAILELFSQYNIHCTWATVGMLFNEDWGEWEKNIPEVTPNYTNKALSAYDFGDSLKSSGEEFYCFAKNLVQQIQDTPNQEVGTHTYSHYYCLEPEQTPASFKFDLLKAIKLAREMGIELKSLVFPRNQFNEDYLDICYELGIENVRSNPDQWYWGNTEKNSLLYKVGRTGDAYFGQNNKSYGISELKPQNGKPLAQKASRLLRPHSSNKLLDGLKIKRIKSEMTSAARDNEIYHLWWHPHNFGDHPEENLRELKIILEHYSYCQSAYGFRSASMMDINSVVKESELTKRGI